jgi:peptidoglycan/LPS O-acetylase OafA/YrhL
VPRRIGYRPSLDGVRALCVLAVVTLHAWPSALPGGWVGVEVFFVLSGYLITSLLLAEHARTGAISLARFYLRRALRLLPALALTIVLALVVAATVRHDLAAATGGQAIAAALYVANWYIAAGHSGGLLNHTWSLALEEQFYLAWPVLLWGLLAVGGRRLALLAAMGGMAVILVHRLGVHSDALYFRTDTRGDSLLLGCAIALSADLGILTRVRRAVVVVCAATGGVLLGLTAATIASMTSAPANYTIVDLAAGAVLVAVAVRPTAVARPLSCRPLVWIGERSYGIYLLHYVVLGALHRPPGPITLAMGLLLSLLAAAASFHYVERPFLRLKSRVASPQPAAVRASVLRAA